MLNLNGKGNKQLFGPNYQQGGSIVPRSCAGAWGGVRTGDHPLPDPGSGTAGRTDNSDGGVEEAVDRKIKFTQQTINERLSAILAKILNSTNYKLALVMFETRGVPRRSLEAFEPLDRAGSDHPDAVNV